MKQCSMVPFGHCPHESTRTVRVDSIGDRAMCQTHADWIVSQGMGRVLEPVQRVEWAKRSLARDFTGRVLA